MLRVLMIYPNQPLLNPPPVSIGTFAALLKERGVDVQVFDTTFFKRETTFDEARTESLQVRPFNLNEKDMPISYNNPSKVLRKIVIDYKPDLITLSCLEATWNDGANLLNSIADLVEVPVVVGGVFPTFAPDIVLKHDAVTMICIGEGEGALVDICDNLKRGNRDFTTINNLWVKNKDGVVKNSIRKVMDINHIPIPDYSVFDPARFLRPMAGRIYRTIPVETIRGCPYSCTFCNSPTIFKLYKDAGAGVFLRKKTMHRIREELRFLIRKWDAEYCYFLSDTFLVMSDREFDAFVEVYSEFKLPFWIQSRPETITPYRAKKLKEIGCHRISIGLEHGNPEFRLKTLKKKFKNSQMVKAADYLADAGIPLTVNNIIGFPDETRELIFETIELNRQMELDTTNAFAFVPFHGTPLHQYCLKKGWIEYDRIAGNFALDAPLDMPQLNRKEIEGLRKTFALYARLPKSYWPAIKKAEQDSEEGRKIFAELSKIYNEKYFN